MKSSTITNRVLSVARTLLLLFGVASLDCPTPVFAQSLVPSDVKNGIRNRSHTQGPRAARELLHEVQREKAGDERMTAVKIRSRSSEALLL